MKKLMYFFRAFGALSSDSGLIRWPFFCTQMVPIPGKWYVRLNMTHKLVKYGCLFHHPSAFFLSSLFPAWLPLIQKHWKEFAFLIFKGTGHFQKKIIDPLDIYMCKIWKGYILTLCEAGWVPVPSWSDICCSEFKNQSLCSVKAGKIKTSLDCQFQKKICTSSVLWSWISRKHTWWISLQQPSLVVKNTTLSSLSIIWK